VPSPSPRTSDPGQLIDLMWNPSTAVGRSGTTVEAIVDAALVIADSDGLDAVTMRAVAERVGIGAMTLYGYVPGKAELVELMVDRVAGRTYEGHPEPHEAGAWDDAVRYIAQRTWEHLLEHPWVVQAPQGRPILGPGVCRTYEAELRPLDGVGLTDLEMDLTIAAVHAAVMNAAQWQTGLARARDETRLSDNQWWALYGPRLSSAMAGEELPVSSRVGQSVANAGDPEATWRFTVDALITALSERKA
jgi:AcrR family transcriptional regulator